MKASSHLIWGSASGPVKRLVPHVRIIVGIAVFATCMIAPVGCWEGVGMVIGTVLAWAFLVRPPLPVVRSTLIFGLALFIPYFLFVPLILEPANSQGWMDAMGVTWTIFFRGLTAMQVSIYTATALCASALNEGVGRLPVPRIVTEVLIQIIHQTGLLIHETRRIVCAIAVRGGTTGHIAGIRVLASFPHVWLLRTVDRAERVGAAMALRGYCERSPAVPERCRISPKDVLALLGASAVLIGAGALRIWKGI